MSANDVPVVVDGPADGVPLLLINGLGAGMRSWSTFKAGLTNRRTIMIDLPPARLGPNAFASMPQLAGELAGILGGLGIGTADVLGYSWGGALAQQFAMDHPSRVRGLVLVATNYGVGSAPLAIGPLVRMVTGRSTDGESVARLLRSIGGRSGGSGPTSVQPADYLRSLQQLYAFVGWSSWPRLGLVKAPTLVLGGDQDPMVSVCTTRILGAAIPHARVRILDGAGHAVLLTGRAVEAAGIVDRFLLLLDRTHGKQEVLVDAHQ